MRARTLLLAISVLASLAFGQDEAQPIKTLYFAHPVNPQNIQEVVNVLRSSVEIQRIAADTAASGITLSGTSTQMALAEWLFQKLDQPADARPASPAQYTIDGDQHPAVRVFYLANLATPRDIQELVNTLRGTADIQRITAYNQVRAIVLRGSANQVGLAEWLVARLDVPAAPGGPAGQNPAMFAYQPEFIRDTATAARVFYLANVRQPQDMQEIVNTIRLTAEIQRITTFNRDGAIVLRGSPEAAALAEWLVSRLDKPAGAQPAAALEYQMAGDLNPIVELYYLSHISAPQDIQELINSIRTMTQLQRVTANNALRAIAVRGKGGQIAQATLLVQQRDRPAQ